MTFKDSLIAVFVAFLWGAQVTAVKIGGIELPPILMVAIRFLIIAIALLPFCKLPDKSQFFPVFWIATITGSIHFGLLYCGISMVDASTSAIAYQLATPFTVLLAFMVLQEKISGHTVFGILLAFAGVILVMGGVGKGGELIGVLLVVLAAFSFAIATVLTKKWGPFNPIHMNGWTAVIAAPELFLLSGLLEYSNWGSLAVASTEAWLALLYTAVSGGLLGFILWYSLLTRHPVHRLSPFTLLVPIFAVAVSQLFLDENITMNLILGGVIAILGVAVCQYRPGKNREKAVPPSSDKEPAVN